MIAALQRLLSAPHRLCFAAAGLVLGTGALWWLAVLAGGVTRWAVPPAPAHGLLMALGFMPFHIAGFLFTAGPRWMQRPPVTTRPLLRPVSAMLAGWGLVLAGVHLDAGLAAAGMASVAAGWAVLCRRLVAMRCASRGVPVPEADTIIGACIVGGAVMGLASVALAFGQVAVLEASLQLALGGFLLPVFLAASHRMLPLFDGTAGRRLALAVAAAWCGDAAIGAWGSAPPVLVAGTAGIDIAVAAWLGTTAWHWWRRHGLPSRLVAMLFTGFAWLAVALALAAAAHAPGTPGSAGRAALHALALGHFGSLLLAMVTRISATHGGRSVAVDRLTAGLFLVLQGAAVTRVTAAWWPDAAGVLLPMAAGAWALVATAWSMRCGRWLVQGGAGPGRSSSTP